MSCIKFLRDLEHFSNTAMLNLDFPSQRLELSETILARCAPFVPAQDRSYRELLRVSCAGAGASCREADCTGRHRAGVCTWWQEGQQEQLALGTKGREGPPSSAGPWALQAVKAPACCPHNCAVQAWRQISHRRLQNLASCWCSTTEVELHCSAWTEN